MNINKTKTDQLKTFFNRDWVEYIQGFEDNYIREGEWNISDRDLEAWMTGCDMSRPYLSEGDKVKVKRYRRDNCKR